MINSEFSYQNDDLLLINKILHFKFILLKNRCTKLSIDDYKKYLVKIVFVNYTPKNLAELIKAINYVNINVLVEYLNSEAVTTKVDLNTITLELLNQS